MTASESESAEARLDPLLRNYREASSSQMESIWNEFAAEHPETSFPSTKTMRQNARLFLAGKRYRFALAVAGFRLLTGERPSRDLERAATWLEWYHLYTLFLDDIMDEDVRRRTLPSAWSANAKLYRGPDADRPAAVFRTRRHRYGVSQAILDALRLRSLGVAFQGRSCPRGRGLPPVEGGRPSGRRSPRGEADPPLRPRARANPAEGPHSVLACVRPRSSDDEEGRGDGEGTPAAVRAPGDGTADRRGSGGGAEGGGLPPAEGAGGPTCPPGPLGRAAGPGPLALGPLGRD